VVHQLKGFPIFRRRKRWRVLIEVDSTSCLVKIGIEGLGRIRLFCKATEILMIDDEKICAFS